MKKLPILLISLAFVVACAGPKASSNDNPPAPGFNAAGSDAKAVAIADEVMQAMGGRKAWDETRFISWNFFGRRKLMWDKHAGLCRIEWLNRPLSVMVNLNNQSGKVLLDQMDQTHPDTLTKYLDLGKKVWINDSYWLVMPFKLKDSGVTLRYLGEAGTEAGAAADLLQLTFAGVGVTPDNKYHVWVDKKTRLITQWAYFAKYSQEKPDIINAWGAYRFYGKVMLSSERGARGSLSPVEVSDRLPEGIFERW